MKLDSNDLNFYKYDYKISTFELPQNILPKFENLYHITNVENALSGLSEGRMTGDMGLHFNLAVYPRSDIARHSGITLKFKFTGEQRAIIDTVGKSRPNYTKLYDNVLYHVYTAAADLSTEEGFLENYWQSIVYPGTWGLEFTGLHGVAGNEVKKIVDSYIGRKIQVFGKKDAYSFNKKKLDI